MSLRIWNISKFRLRLIFAICRVNSEVFQIVEIFKIEKKYLKWKNPKNNFYKNNHTVADKFYLLQYDWKQNWIAMKINQSLFEGE